MFKTRTSFPPDETNAEPQADNAKDEHYYPPRRSRRLAPPDPDEEGPAVCGGAAEDVVPPRRVQNIAPVPAQQADEDEPEQELPDDGNLGEPIPDAEEDIGNRTYYREGDIIRERLRRMAQVGGHDRPPRDETPERVRRLFGRLRRYGQLPPTEKLAKTLQSGRNPCGLDKNRVFRICEVLHQALLVCNGDRQEASVLSALELRAREGEWVHGVSEVTELTGQRTGMVRHCLDAFHGRGIVDQVCGWHTRYELIRPLFKLLEAPASKDPLHVLRQDAEELNRMSDDVLYTLALKAAERAADDRLKEDEMDTISRIADEERLLAEQEQAYRALGEQVHQRRDSIIELKRTLSRLRWSKRHPFDVQEQQEHEDYPRPRRFFREWM